MDLLDLFKPDSFQRIRIPKLIIPDDDPLESSESNIPKFLPHAQLMSGTDYVKKYVEEEERKVLDAARESYKIESGNLDEISVGTAPVSEPADLKKLDHIYKTYKFEYRPKHLLPIVQVKDDIIKTIKTHSITVIEGVTGCGKSTQVPQFILDSCFKTRTHCNIIVTQPRRIAATSIANRVSKERDWPLGSVVGCQVGLYKNVSEVTRLTYCTTGILLRKLVSAKNMDEYTHIIIDEVHERDQEMDFLLLVIRKLHRTNSRSVKIILMSATFNVEKFAEYFSIATEKGFVKAPIISIPKKRNYTVTTHYLNELSSLGPLPVISESEPKVSKEMLKFCKKLIKVFDDIDDKSEYDPEDLDDYENGMKPRYSVLVFLPGIWEIEEMHNLLIVQKDFKWDIVVLHSSITSEEQRKIFIPPAKGYRRIILSTNIAESSITIDDIKYVIDFCLTKQLVTDPATNFQCLELSWASKANCDQRSGRAGRIMDGRIYRLVSQEFYEQSLRDEGHPEIVTAPLENLVLNTKLLDMGEPKAILALAIDPPDLSNLERTILLLKEVGGLVNVNPGCDRVNRFDGEITDLGRIMAHLPVEIHIAKMIALGHAFSVLRDAIIMGASMTQKSMFSTPFKEKIKSYTAKLDWSDSSRSDPITFLDAYNTWYREIVASRIKRGSNAEVLWCKRKFIQVKVIHEVDHLVGELTRRLEMLGIKETVGPNKVVMDSNHPLRAMALRFTIAGAFYPNYFIKTGKICSSDETHGTRELGGLDPTKTVFLQGWKHEYPGKLYAKRFQEAFKDCIPHSYQQALVEFDGSSRVYIMFNDDQDYFKNDCDRLIIPGEISLSVYKALKMRNVNPEPIRIPVLDLKTSKLKAEALGIATNTSTIFYNEENYEALRRKLPPYLPILPPLDIDGMPLEIIHPLNRNFNISKFYARLNNKNTWQKLKEIDYLLNSSNITHYSLQQVPQVGSLLIAPIYNNKERKLYRAIVESINVINEEHVANMYFLDFGFHETISIRHLLVLPENHHLTTVPGLAFECTLTGLQPKTVTTKNEWSQKAITTFIKYTSNDKFKVFASIFSVVDSVVSVTLKSYDSYETEFNINEILLREGLAEPAEESYLSKYNNNVRNIFRDKHDFKHMRYLGFLQYGRKYIQDIYPDPPDDKECIHYSPITLRGPYSPLESTFTSLAIAAASKKISVDSNSVNSVLVTSKDEVSDRLLVAATVSQNTTGSRLTLRNTTLMPNLNGLTSLICLVFSPAIELRRSSRGSYYVGALCGLGYDPKNFNSLLPEHDLEVPFDSEFTLKDLEDINKLRHWLNCTICIKGNNNSNFEEEVVRGQRKVNEFLVQLMSRSVKPIKSESIQNFGNWGKYEDNLLRKITNINLPAHRNIYPFFPAIILEEQNEELDDLLFHMQELRDLAVSDVKLQENIEVTCRLCDKFIIGKDSLRAHLYSKVHKQNEKDKGLERAKHI